MLTLTADEASAMAEAVPRYRKTVTEFVAEARAELDGLVARVQARRHAKGSQS